MNVTAVRGEKRNALLGALSETDFALLQPHLEPVSLKFRKQLQGANRPVTDVYFPDTGLASVVAIGAGRRAQAEVAIIGSEGMTGLPIVLGANRSPCDIFMQMQGHGQRIAADKMRPCLEQSATLLRCFLRYVHVSSVQSAYTALANAKGKIDERLARWLLMAHDRVDGNRLFLTHEFLALMIGTRRAGVTVALGQLEADGTIELARSAVTVLDRHALEAAANGFYGAPEAEFKRLFA